ncbi:MAG: hypothetical protein K2O12_04680, partial [Muribaculaceae bacterium]|nr:hypothetical protein [Muribaculaceae bacterium]
MYTLVAVINLNAQQEASDSLTRELQEIIVTAKQPATRLVGTSLVSTIAGSNLADLGNALDVLAQLPMINVQDNAVNVIGRSNIEIYINGRPMRDKQELQQILSSDLKKVELIMAPGACYESTTGAVLKITTKRNLAHGLSLSDQFKLQRRRKWSVMDDLSLSYRTDNWEFFLNGTISHNNSLAKGFTTNTFMYGGKETVVGGSQYNSFSSTTGILKSGFSYTKDSHSFGAYYQYTPEHEDFNNNGSEWIDNSSPIIRNIDKRTHGNSHLVSAYYENTFGGKYRLHFDGDFRQSAAGNNVATSYIDATNPDVCSTDRHRSTLWAGKMYLSFPLCDGDFTVGTQDSHTQTSLDYHMLNSLVEEYIPSSLT